MMIPRKPHLPLLGLAILLFSVTPGGSKAADQILSPGKLKQWMDQGRPYVLVDVRFEDQFQKGHIPGAIDIPAVLLKHKPLPSTIDVVLYDNDLSGMTVRNVKNRLQGPPPNRVYLLSGGMRAWEGMGYATTRPGGVYDPAVENLVSAKDLAEAIRIGVPLAIVDLRDAKAYRAKGVPGSINIPMIQPAEVQGKLKSDSIQEMVVLSDTSKKKLAATESKGKTSKEAAEELMAEDLAHQLGTNRAALGKAGLTKSSKPVVLVDDGSDISRRILPRMARYGYPNVLRVERGFVGWEAATGKAAPSVKEVIVHGDSTVAPIHKPESR